MLQGPDLSAIEAAVVQQRGVITHHLPIISALGARLSRAQLEAIQAADLEITRVIDDLAWEPEPEIPQADECQFAGAIELQWDGSSATWALFNKGSETIKLSALEVAWPPVLGALRNAKLSGDQALKFEQSESLASWTWDETTAPEIAAESHQTLTLTFEEAPDAAAALQSEFVLKAKAGDDCQSKLVPSYRYPEEDSYYPSVSGAASLHMHGVTGQGIAVAVLDSGLWEDHPELAMDTQGNPRIIARYDAIQGKEVSEAFDESGHGTHMSSVIARSGRVTREAATRPSYRGIAPDVSLVAIKAFGESGEAGFLDIVRGIQWVVEHREQYNIRVLNLSFAARPRWPYWEDPVNQALMRAWQNGIFVSAAAGNEGPDPMTVGSPGNLPYVLTVGAITDSWTEDNRDDDYIPDFSSRGPTPLGHIKPDVVAPGGHISGVVRPGSTLEREFPEYLLHSGEFVMTGTSQATALVSGLAALMLQLEPKLTNDAIKCLLKTSAEPAIELDGRLAYSPFAQGEGLVSVQRALTIGTPSCDQQALDLNAEVAGLDHFQGPAIFTDTAPPSLPGEEALISEPPDEEGPSPTLRWGAAAHLQRLDQAPQDGPIDWLGIHAREQQRFRDMAEGSP